MVPDCYSMLQTREQHIQCIRDLLAIVKAQPKYKHLDTDRFTANTQPREVIQWLLRKLGPLASGHHWSVDTYQDGRRTRYCFVVWDTWSNQVVYNDWYVFTLEFLPLIKKKAPGLHDMIIDVIAFMSKRLSIPLWDEHPDFMKAIEGLRVPEDHGGLGAWLPYERRAYIYHYGEAAKYAKLIRRRRRTVTVGDIYAAEVRWKSRRELWLKHNLLQGTSLAEAGGSIADYQYVPHSSKHQSKTVPPSRCTAFAWSDHEHDPVIKQVKKVWGTQGRQYGNMGPIRFQVTKPGQKIKVLPNSDFPARFTQWFHYMDKHIYTGQYADYYSKNSYNHQQTASEKRLIDSIDEQHSR